jgi:hypothetical protein
METEHKSGKKREITYHVGWKKGRIQGDSGQASPAKDDAPMDAITSSKLFRLYQRYIWREAQVVRQTWLFPLWYLLPILIFALTFILVYTLSNI